MLLCFLWYHEGRERALSGMFDDCHVEAMSMGWLKRDLWKAGIALASMLLLLVFMVWVPVSVAAAHKLTPRLAGQGIGTVQATSTEDATVTALNKEKLVQEVQQLKNQNEPDPLGWLRTNASIFLSTFVVVVGGLFGLWRWRVDQRYAQNKELEDRKAERERRDEEQKRWLEDRKAEREKRVEERFQSAVTGLGDEKEGARIGAAILLKTFLRLGYEQFYTQIFQLVAANLRLPRTPNPPEDPAAPLPLTALRHALMMTFMEAFPLARDQEKKNVRTKLADNEYKVRSTHPAPVTISSAEIHSLNAVSIRLDNGFLWYADLKQAWMAQASLRKTDLTGADLSEANLYAANLSEAYLWETNLSGATLWQANLYKADLRGTNLSKAYLVEANLSEASLYYDVDLQGATLRKANLSGASLQQVDLRGADLSEAKFNRAKFSKANPEDALSLANTDLRGVEGLKKEQLEACKAKGAIIDEDHSTSSPQSTLVPSSPSQSHDAQASSAPSAQGSLPPTDTDRSSAVSSKPDSES